MSGGNKYRGEDIIQKDDLDKAFVNRELVKYLQDNGFYVCSVELANRFMKESLELAQLKATYATTVSKGD